MRRRGLFRGCADAAKRKRHGALRGCRPAPGSVQAKRVPCGGDPAGRGLPDDGQRLFPAPDRCGPGSGGADLRKAPLLYRPTD